MKWTENFISQCLAEVPEGKYRTRTEAELRDHLECQRRTSPTVLGRTFPMYGNPVALTIFGSSLFLLPFSLGALYLRTCFRDAHRPAVWMTLGLLAAWAGEKTAIIGISALVYQMPLGLDLLHRISRGGDVTGPWFTPAYIVLTFLGCLILGQLFGRKAERRHELT